MTTYKTAFFLDILLPSAQRPIHMSQTVGFEYDALSRVLAELQDGREVEREFDPNGNVLRLHYPSGKVVEKEYNALNRPEVIQDSSGGIAGLGWGWDKMNRPSVISLATSNQVNGVIAYDQRGFEWKREYRPNTGVLLYSS